MQATQIASGTLLLYPIFVGVDLTALHRFSRREKANQVH
jgi:hypothetical protein